ncbi:MAG: hypothetical protein R3F56_12860 [Planctomycetota bacterium]
MVSPRALALALPLAALLSLAAVRAPAQDVATHLRRLDAVEAPQREDARRRLAVLSAAELPVEALLERTRAGGEGAAAAADVLARHADLHEALRRQVDIDRADHGLLIAALPALRPDQLWQVVLGHRVTDPHLAEQALGELWQRRALDAPDVVTVLGQEQPPGPGVRAADLLAHAALPAAATLAAIAAEPVARQRLLRALVDHPRPDYVDWLQHWIDDPADATTSLFAIAALPPDAQTPAHARLVLRLFDAQTPPFLTDLAAARFSTRVADGLVSAAHAALLDGKRIGDLLPLFLNVSTGGEEHLLGLAGTVPPADREAVCRWLELRDSPALARRVAAALDGEIALEDVWLQRAGPQLTNPARVARVVQVLEEPEPRCIAAFEVLVEAGRYDPRMLRLIEGDDASIERARHLLRLPRDVLPNTVVHGLLRHRDGSVRLAAVHALAVPHPRDEDQAALAALLAEDADDGVRAACARALTAFGDDGRAQAAFAVAFGSAFGEEAVEWLLQRPRPFGRSLLAGVRAERSSRRQLDDLETGMVRLGDHALLPALLARVGELPPRLVRRLQPVLAAIDDRAVVGVLAAAAVDPELSVALREPLVAALAARADTDTELLRRIFVREDDDGIRAAALQGLLGTEVGRAMLAELGAKIGTRSLQRSDEDLAFEVLGAARLPLASDVVALAARLVLVAPLASPVAEADRTLSDAGVVADYPLVQPLGELIRRAPRREHGEAIAAAVAAAVAHPEAHALSRRRLGHLLSFLAWSPEAYDAAAPALARAMVAAPDTDISWLGPAWLEVARDAEANDRLAAAASAYEAALGPFLRDPRPAVQRRRFLPDPDPARGRVPLAAVAARPSLLRARLALARGDLAAARRELDAARPLATCDRATLTEIAALADEIARR